MEEGIIAWKEYLIGALGLGSIVVLVMFDMPDIPIGVKLAIQTNVYIMAPHEKVEVPFANSQE